MASYHGIGLLLALVGSCIASGDWGYYHDRTATDPSRWGSHYPQCRGDDQSPVNIDTSRVLYDPSLGQLRFRGYTRTLPWGRLELKNNGHTVVVSVPPEDHISIEGGGLDGRYRLVQAHMHWGSRNAYGSEHTWNGRPYPMEVHLVHVHERFSTVTEALSNGGSKALAVIGIFVKVGSHSYEYGYDKIVSSLQAVKVPDTTVPLPEMSLAELLPSGTVEHNEFVRYSGSLTTPPCSQVVTWTLLRKPVTLSPGQLSAFRSLIGAGAVHRLVDNFRYPQPLNGRLLTSNTEMRYRDMNENNFANRYAL